MRKGRGMGGSYTRAEQAKCACHLPAVRTNCTTQSLSEPSLAPNINGGGAAEQERGYHLLVQSQEDGGNKLWVVKQQINFLQ